MGHIKTELNEEKNFKQLRLPRTEAEWNEREVQLMEKEKKMQGKFWRISEIHPGGLTVWNFQS